MAVTMFCDGGGGWRRLDLTGLFIQALCHPNCSASSTTSWSEGTKGSFSVTRLRKASTSFALTLCIADFSMQFKSW